MAPDACGNRMAGFEQFGWEKTGMMILEGGYFSIDFPEKFRLLP